MGRGWSRETLANALLAGAAALALYAAAVALTGGFELRVAGVRLRSHAWVRPALAAAFLAAVFGVLARRRVAAASSRSWQMLDHGMAARLFAVGAVAWSVAAGIQFGTFAVGGSDSYGYVSQAALLASGRLTDTVPLDPSHDWYLAHMTLTPLGYRPVPGSARIAPTYPPGLPLLMAPVWRISPSAVYYLVPLFAGLTVWLCYRLGRALGDPLAGGLAAVLLSVSPPFLFQAMQPMSDVPAAACWLGALLLAYGGTATRSAFAGAIASVAILIRPNLAPLAIVPLALIAWTSAGRRTRLRNAALSVAAAVPAAITFAWIQYVRHGSPWSSGYGDLDYLFGWENIALNVVQYPTWLTETHTPFVWCFALAPWALKARSALAWSALLFSAGVFALYLPYTAFQPHEWTYLRFLLPAIPLILLLASCAALAVVRRVPLALRAPLAAVVFGAVAVYSAQTAEKRRTFELQAEEQRYADAGAFVRQRLPANAIVLAGQHSGSVRLYGDRPILRFDLLQPADLDRALALLRASGRDPFMVIDPWERAVFYERFSAPYQKTLDTARLIRVVANVQIYAFD